MGFLDNSGDIILDAVLTDLGRMRLAKGDGTFKISQFAIGDDEINYNLYDTSAAAGSEDLTIMDTPVLEAFTNNTTLLKSKLMSIDNNNHLYLPILKLNQNNQDTRLHSTTNAFNMFVIAADKDTAQGVHDTSTNPSANNTGIMPMGDIPTDGYINGVDVEGTKVGGYIRVDQGIDNNTELTPKDPLGTDLYESQYAIEIDGRIGTIVSSNGNISAAANFIGGLGTFTSDDDFMVTYYLTSDANTAFVTDNVNTEDSTTTTDVKGPRGSRLEFKIRTTNQARSDSLYTLIGRTSQTWTQATSTATPALNSTMTVHYIDTTVRITGLTTGYRLDLPVRIVKKA